MIFPSENKNYFEKPVWNVLNREQTKNVFLVKNISNNFLYSWLSTIFSAFVKQVDFRGGYQIFFTNYCFYVDFVDNVDFSLILLNERCFSLNIYLFTNVDFVDNVDIGKKLSTKSTLSTMDVEKFVIFNRLISNELSSKIYNIYIIYVFFQFQKNIGVPPGILVTIENLVRTWHYSLNPNLQKP